MRLMFLNLIVLLAGLGLFLETHAQERAVPDSTQQMQLSFSPLVKKVAPAVVNIYTKRVVERQVLNPFFNDPLFGRLFQDNMFGGRLRQQLENSLGSGVIVEPDGLIVTNAHVVADAQEITVSLSDGREFEADIALRDEASDLALLRIREKGLSLPHVTLKASETLEVGDLVLAVGNPFGVGQTVTSGIVSAQGRSSLDINDFNFFIQTDAAINPGNSGGPLVAMDGGVVGINTAIFSQNGGSLGIGFAIPSEMVATVIAAGKNGRTGDEGVARPWLGVSVQNITADIAASLGLEKPAGVLVAQLHPASPLKDAGMTQGDVILSINGREIRDGAELKFRMATVPIGERASFKIIRKGKPMTFNVKATTPPEVPPRAPLAIEAQHPLQGATVVNINPAVIVEYGLPVDQGVVVADIARGSPASRLVRSGDIIAAINERPIETTKDLEKAIANGARGPWSFVLSRNGQKRQVVVR